MSEKKKTQDVTRQSLSLARTIDRLPPGEYNMTLGKSDRSGRWSLVITKQDGETVKNFEGESD